LTLSRRELLQRGAVLAGGLAVARLRWVDRVFAATPNAVDQTMRALVSYVVAGKKLEAATTPRLIRTLDRFLPGPVPLSATAASILNGAAAQVRPGATFAKLTRAEKAKVFATLEQLSVETAGSIRFLVGNLADLTAFLAYSTQRGRKLSRYSGLSHGHKEFKGYWHA
jgi:hypothetical protein